MKKYKTQQMLVALLLSVFSSMSFAAEKRSLCVFDIIGTYGDVYRMSTDFKIKSLEWGVDFELKPYTDERIAAADFKAGQCDAVIMTGLRGRAFNPYTGSLDSIGAIPSYKHMHTIVKVLSHPKYATKMKHGPYEVAGIVPMGAAYLFVNDKSINNVEALSGKKIAVLDYDKSQAKLVSQIGASPVSSDITNFAGKFNNGSVDICAAPAIAYSALELYKGLEPNGGIIDLPLAQITIQMIVRDEKFTDEFTQQTRQYFLSQYEQVVAIIEKARAEIDKKYWISIPEKDQLRYNAMMRESRISLRKEGIYNADMMSLLRKVRCKLDPAQAECTEKLE